MPRNKLKKKTAGDKWKEILPGPFTGPDKASLEMTDLVDNYFKKIGFPSEIQLLTMLLLWGNPKEMHYLIEWIQEKEPTCEEMVNEWLLDFLKKKGIIED